MFEAQQILAVPFKGPLLAASVYGDVALRQFSDLDILMHQRDILRAKALPVDQGYRPVLGAEGEGRNIELNEALEVAHLRFAHAYVFVRPEDAREVDLHWQFTRRYFAFPLDLQDLRERLETVSFADSVVKQFSPEDMLLILCVHGAKSLWQRLLWICDVAELVTARGHDLDWERLLARAERLGVLRMLSLGLQLASNLLDMALPEAVRREVEAEPVAAALAAQIQSRLFVDAQPPGESAVEKLIMYLSVRERWRDKVQYFTLTPNVKDLMFLPLPAPLTPLYYMLRPIRLIRAYGGGVWYHLRSTMASITHLNGNQ